MTERREPPAGERRLSGVPSRPGPHDSHDLALVVDLATDARLDPASAAAARSLVAACPDCATLAADLAVIVRATAASTVPARTRDFRLTPDQAARLQPSRLRRFLMRLAASDGAVLRPLAGRSWPSGSC